MLFFCGAVSIVHAGGLNKNMCVNKIFRHTILKMSPLHRMVGESSPQAEGEENRERESRGQENPEKAQILAEFSRIKIPPTLCYSFCIQEVKKDQKVN